MKTVITLFCVLASMAACSTRELNDEQAGMGHSPFAAAVLPPESKDTTFPNGRKNVFLFGNRNHGGLFVERDFFPKGYFGDPHSHDRDFLVTILSGSANFRYGILADTSKPALLKAGSFFVIKANQPHYEWFSEDCILQIEGLGPVKTMKLDSLIVKTN